jgi:hypothetical protein
MHVVLLSLNFTFVDAHDTVGRWLGFFGGGGPGPAIYYDDTAPFQGWSLDMFYGVTWQPNQHIKEDVSGNHIRFLRDSTREKIYELDIVNSKTTYQFDKHFLVRFLAQYDSSEHRVLTDLLASYELVPGTVFHAGYGSLYEQGGVTNPPPGTDQQYRAVNRGLFFKASYLHRF